MWYNPEIPLEVALEMFDDPHTRYEIIEDYYAALGKVALPDVAIDDHIILGED